jgi:hypothetical protein
MNNKSRAANGKGDSPRNNFSQNYRSNYASINWKHKKTKKPSHNTYQPKKP